MSATESLDHSTVPEWEPEQIKASAPYIEILVKGEEDVMYELQELFNQHPTTIDGAGAPQDIVE